MYEYNDYIMVIFSHIDHEIPSSCVTMNYYEQSPNDDHFQAFYYGGDTADYIEYYEGCYSRGGRLLYKRRMTHFGTCSPKIPCSVTSSEGTLIYEYVCV